MTQPKLSAAAEALSAALDKSIGGNEEVQGVKLWIDTGDAELNYCISGKYDGGIPVGRIVEMYGPPSAGKTAEATDLLIRVQKMGGVAIFIDWERSFDIGLAKNLGLSDQRPYWIYKTPETWEEGNAQAIRAIELIRASGVIDPEAPILVVLDSIASAVPQSMLYDSKGNKREMTSLTMNDTSALSRVTSNTLKLVAQSAEQNNTTFLYLNQQRTKIGVMFGDPTTTPGGSAPEFYSSVRIALGRTKLYETVGGKKQFVGQDIATKVVKTKHTKPFQETSMRMWFDDKGVAYFDRHFSLVEFLKKVGALKTSGSYIEWTDGKKYFPKALVEKLKADPTGLSQLRALIPSVSPDASTVEVNVSMDAKEALDKFLNEE